MSSDEVVLVVGSGGRRYREYLLAGAARKHRLWLLDAAEPTWQHPYVTGVSVVPLLDEARIIPDQDALLKAADEVAGRLRVRGVFTYDETLVIATAHIADELGLPGLSVHGAQNCRDKHRTRQMLTMAQVPQPQFELVASLDDATAAARRIGLPVILKPRGMGASIGVVRVERFDDLPDAFRVALAASYGGNPSFEGGVLVEQMLTGSEISVDGLVFDGEYQPLFVARKSVGLAPYFEEIGHVVDPADELLTDPAVIDLLRRTHHATGIRNGITHTEVMLTGDGPAVVEVNGRLGGDLIPYLGMLATGIDPGRVAADIAVGVRPDIEPSRGATFGIRFAYPPRDCRVRAVSTPLPGASPGLVEAAPLAEPGAELRLPPKGYIARYAYVICTGDDPGQCARRLDAAIDLVVLAHEEPGEDPLGLIG